MALYCWPFFAFAGGTELGKYKIFAVAFPLYCKIRKKKVLDNFLRGRIYEHICSNPGASYNRIMHQLGVRNGTLAHHLRMLEHHEMVYGQRDGIHKRFFPSRMKTPKRPYLTELQELILDTVKENPGATQVDIARKLDRPKQVVHYHMRHLSKAGMIRRVKKGRKFKCYIKGQ